jgi:cellulose synthase/poly-beta-1,6-N-acetylglucosamine synthase-like glycosyltransferase/spore germination protein YaaH/peptidoglycan/xylan/chitin deacetylase (PgdA/CDA1 family)
MIFEDPTQKRWKITRLTFWLIMAIFVVLAGIWISSLIVNPPLPSFTKRPVGRSRSLRGNVSLNKILAQENTTSTSTNPRVIKSNIKLSSMASSTLSLQALNPQGLISTAFLVQDDAESVRSYQAHKDSLDIVFPDWYFLASSTCGVDEKADPDITKIINSNSKVAIFPRLANVRNGKWLGDELGQILHSQDNRNCLAQTISTMLASSTARGINLDFESLSPEDREHYLEFLISLTDLLHRQNKLVTVDVPARDSAFDLSYIGKIADGVVLMSYDQHYAGGAPGPIAADEWFDDTFDEVAAEVPANKLLVAIGQYGYDWTADSTRPAKSLGFSETMDLAREVESQPEMEKVSQNMFFAYQDDNNKQHQVWFLNGITAWNEFVYLRQKHVLGLSLWRLGTEDPTFWQLSKPGTTADDFTKVPALSNVRYESEGELFRVKSQPSAGQLQLTINDDDGSIDYAQYQALPSGYLLDQVGNPMPANSLVLTFDDGPDPVWTPQILAVLKTAQVPAAFFMVGDQAQRYPDVVKQIASAGLLVGNHTYSHPDISTISDSRIHLELNRTERYIETEYGRKTAMFRPPYNTDSTPSSPEQLRALEQVNQMGYIVAAANIDSEDWSKPGVDQIIHNITSQLGPNNHIIVMHDAGGDRSETVAALTKLIPLLRSQGYNFLSLDQASGVNKDLLMPPLDPKEWLFLKATDLFAALKWGSWELIVYLFFFTTVIAILRIIFLGAMVLRSAKHYVKRSAVACPNELVSVLIPAYNEEATIAKTLQALRHSTYQNLEILVINDGSTDQTSTVVKAVAQTDQRIRLIEKTNGGKSSAANLGLEQARGQLVVTIDADTILYPFTIAELIKPFADPQVDAVCGNVEVGNVHNLLTGFQALEYITSQNFDRRAFDELNCISVVPGATGAWRKSKIIGVGGYMEDTLTEDADLTLRLLINGGRIVYAPEARSRTEAPETVSALAKQRFRWSYGTFQCLSKNTKYFFSGTLGWVALPNMFLFQVLFPLLSPIGDLVLVLALFRGDLKAILAGYIMFIFMDLFGSLLAFTLERRSKKLMWLILIQRFFYRQFMYYITYKSILAMLKGRRHGWNKLERRGTVKI